MGFPFLLQKKGKGMSNLRTNYKDDVFTGKRKYNQINNGDGTISFDDVTEYEQVGDTYGAAQINETNDVINNLDSKAYKNTDSAENSIADNDYFPFFDVSANASKKTLWSNIKSVLTNVFAIKTHASNTTVYGTGNSNLYGHVKLSDNYTSSAGAASAAVGASSKAVNDAYNANKNSITVLSGTVSTNAATETNHYNALATRASNLETRAGTLENELTANSKRIYMDYKNGKYGINTSANRGADTFIPFSGLVSADSFSISFDTSGAGGYSSGHVYFPLWVLKDLKLTQITGTLSSGGLSLVKDGGGNKQINLPYTLTDSDLSTYTTLSAIGAGNTPGGGSSVLSGTLTFSQP